MDHRKSCPSCGEMVAWLTLYNGRSAPFNPDPRDPDPERGLPAERWFAMRGQGMTPSNLLPEAEIEGRQYLTQHRCVRAVRAPDDATMIALTSAEPLTTELVLDPRHEYTYRWPGNWAHILGEYQYRAICGETMPQGRRVAPRERERLRNMRVCPKCSARLSAPVGRGRQLVSDIRAAMLDRAQSSAGVDPRELGAYVRRRFGTATATGWQSPWHKVDCPAVAGVKFNALEWIGSDYMPHDGEPCTTCRPQRPLSELAAEAELLRGRRRRASLMFRHLGPYVYMSGVVHRNDCTVLADYADSTGWKGSTSLEQKTPCAICEPDLIPMS